MATARLRKTFQYPSENDSDEEGPEAMDEEEQESLIHQMHQANTSRNKQYTHALLFLTLLSTIPYIPTLFASKTALLSLLSLLSLTSLLSTAYLLLILPAGRTGLSPLDALNTSPEPQSIAKRKEALLQAGGGPVEVWLP